jgi:lysozyme family protein
MADWNIAYNWMMDNEDEKRACRQVPDASPNGVAGPCFAICGINSAVFPAEFEAIAALPQESRETSVRQFYQNHFWNQWFAQLSSDDLCKRVFDFAINAGSGASVRCLQQAINALAAAGTSPLAEDGGWGPLTLATANAADPAALQDAFTARRVAYYRAIAAAHPGKQRYLAAWIKRAEA